MLETPVMKELIAYIRTSQRCNHSRSNIYDDTFDKNRWQNFNLKALTILAKGYF